VKVNIDDHAKCEALLYTEQHDFISLSLVRKKFVYDRRQEVRKRERGEGRRVT